MTENQVFEIGMEGKQEAKKSLLTRVYNIMYATIIQPLHEKQFTSGEDRRSVICFFEHCENIQKIYENTKVLQKIQKRINIKYKIQYNYRTHDVLRVKDEAK